MKKYRLSGIRRLTAGLTDHEHPAISPDGGLVAFYAGEYGSIFVYVVDRRGRLARLVSQPAGNNTQPAWHPSGNRLAWRHQDSPDAKWEIWETNLLEGDAPRQVLADQHWHYKHPSWSPCSRRMAYFSDEGSTGVFHLWVMDLESGEKQQLTNDSERNDCHPVFSPDGGRLVFHAYEEISAGHEPPITNLFELNLVDNSIRRLTDLRDQVKHPFYLDDKTVTFHHEVNATGIRRIALMSLKKLKPVYLTDGSDNDKHPFPGINSQGERVIAWSSKKLGSELEGESNTYDVFIARLRHTDKSEKAGKGEKKAAKKAKQLVRERKKDFRPKKDRCGNCSFPLVMDGVITSWRDARQHKVKGKDKACTKCPSRMVLD